METIDYGDLILWRPSTATPYYIYMYIDPIGWPYTKIYIYIKVLAKQNWLQKNEFDCKKNEFNWKTMN